MDALLEHETGAPLFRIDFIPPFAKSAKDGALTLLGPE